MSHTPLEDLRLRATSESSFNHPMNSDMGPKAVATIRQTIKRSKERIVSRKTKERDGTTSSVWCLQLFIDRFQTLLRAGSVGFYSLHITFLNYYEEQRRRHINNGRTICAHLPVPSRRINNEFSSGKLGHLDKETEHKHK